MKSRIQGNEGILRYLPSLIFVITASLSFAYQPFNYLITIVISFGIIPILELFLNPVTANYEVKSKKSYNSLLYLVAVLHYILLLWFLTIVSENKLTIAESVGIVSTMGILCGVYGINVAHELGHRKEKQDQIVAQSLLLTSLYMHFFIEHNRGHHKKVGTPEDPATARINESIYVFWIRSIVGSWISAYRLEKERLKRIGKPVFSISNQFIRFQIIQFAFLCLIVIFFSWISLIFFLASALIGIVLLESINYVEHYGLQREKLNDKVFAGIAPEHSWNSNHPLGRYILFELSRHSDHHQNSSTIYPELKSQSEAPQLPTGYPGMMLLALIPPLWKRVMNKRLIGVKS
ncbi:MAG: alkane 1-monooxygenase [Bacteroidia bacterium]